MKTETEQLLAEWCRKHPCVAMLQAEVPDGKCEWSYLAYTLISNVTSFSLMSLMLALPITSSLPSLFLSPNTFSPSISLSLCPAEKVTSLGKDWHKFCLKCERCSKTLNPGGHAEVGSDDQTPWRPWPDLHCHISVAMETRHSLRDYVSVFYLATESPPPGHVPALVNAQALEPEACRPIQGERSQEIYKTNIDREGMQ